MNTKFSIIAVLTLAFICVVGCQRDSRQDPSHKPPPKDRTSTDSPAIDLEAVAVHVNQFCGDCHATPPPSGFAKKDWRGEVNNGFDLYLTTGRSDLEMPVLNDVVKYYQSLAPEELQLPARDPGNTSFADAFRKTNTGKVSQQAIENTEGKEAVAHIEWLVLPNANKPTIVFSCLRTGHLISLDPMTGREQRLATLTNPTRFAQCDLDGDGHQDFVVGDLGGFKTEDHNRGNAYWLRWHPEQKKFETYPLFANGIGRTAAVQPGDFDGDGDVDLIVGEFGWLKTGGVHLLINQGAVDVETNDVDAESANSSARLPVRFEHSIVDNRHGPINVPVMDLDQDGDPDFVTLFGQEHESLVFFENVGDMSFRKATLFQTPDPSFGSSGIQAVDFDNDGDLDFLYANGDAYDRYFIKPFHGVRLLENKGDLEFVAHHLGYLPGAHRAMPIDFDGDGDPDVVAVSNLPENLNRSQKGTHDSVVLFRNNGEFQFERGLLEEGCCTHSTSMVADLDGDGDDDFVTGNSSETAEDKLLTIWWNQLKSPENGSAAE